MTEDDWFEEALRELRDEEPADSTEVDSDATEVDFDADESGTAAAEGGELTDAEGADAEGTDAEGTDATGTEKTDPTAAQETDATEKTESAVTETESAAPENPELTAAEESESPPEKGAGPTAWEREPTDETEQEPTDEARADFFSDLGGGGFETESEDASNADIFAGSTDTPDAAGRDDVFGFENAPRSEHGGDREEFVNLGGDASSFDSGGGTKGEKEEFGFADFDGGFSGGFSGSEFDEESFESDIDRVKLGIEGLDEMILGGIPDRSLIAVIGSAGTGKTTFALQFLTEALRNGKRAVYLTLEQSREAILDTAEEKGWSFRDYEAEDQLAVVSIDPIEMANSLASIRNELAHLIEDFEADRLVLDSVSLLEMMYDHPAKRRSEVFDFTRSLKEAGVTTMLTSEASEETPYASRYGVVEYLTDAVFILQYVRPDEFHETRLAVEIQKIRDANHSRETKPYDITNDGISVYRQANIF